MPDRTDVSLATPDLREPASATVAPRYSRYVIIGCGFAAVLNHVTLRARPWGQTRVGAQKVLHIGFEDPWRHYVKHEMGQYPHLLRPPSYAPLKTPEPPQTYRNSRLFGAGTLRELRKLVRRGDAEVFHGWVAVIQPRDLDFSAPPPHAQKSVGNVLQALQTINVDTQPLFEPWSRPDADFRLLVVQPGPGPLPVSSLVYANLVDVCVGLGVPNQLPVAAFSDPAIHLDYATYPWEAPEQPHAFRFAISGQHALYEKNPLPAPRANGRPNRSCVYGGGGVSVNLVETRIPVERVDWVSRDTHTLVLVDSRRNHHLFSAFPPLRLVPAKRRLRLGAYLTVKDVSAGTVDFDFSPSLPIAPGPVPTVVNSKNAFVAVTGRYDQLILSIGQLDSVKDPGTACFITQLLGGYDWILTDDRERAVGVETGDGRVRILGAAAIKCAKGISNSAPWTLAIQFHNTLPLQAQVGGRSGMGGITYNAVAIAHANHYFTAKALNHNVNTASEIELTQILNDQLLAHRIVALRETSVAGFEDRNALKNALGGHWTWRMWLLKYAY